MSTYQPRSLGFWIAFADRIPGGHAGAVDNLLAVGASWVCIRAGDGNGRDPSWSVEAAKAAIPRYRAAGIDPIVWYFSNPWSWTREVALARQLMDEGAAGIVIDAETSWDVGQVDTAARYMEMMRKPVANGGLGESTFVADAPWPWPKGHPSFPYEAFAKGVDMRLPQAYADEIGIDVVKCLARSNQEWGTLEAGWGPVSVRPRYPIMDTYSHVTTITTAEMDAFFAAYANEPDAPISLYSLEAALKPPYQKEDPGIFAYLVKRADALRALQRQAPTIVPPPDPAPLQSEIQDEQDAGQGAEIPPHDRDRK
jgi:hypothetical protein